MSNSDAFKTNYREETVDEFEQNQSLLRQSVTTEFMRENGSQNVVFLVAGSGGATATTRGADGELVYRENSNTQNTCVLKPWYDAVNLNNFDIFAAQGNQKRVAQRATAGTLNRKCDKDIIAQLDTATVQTSATAAKGTVKMILHGQTILTNSDVPQNEGVTALISSGYASYLLQSDLANVDYVNVKPNADGSLNWRDRPNAFQWNGIMFIVHPHITGVGTATEKCYVYHSASIGHAFDTENFSVDMGYEGRHRRSWVNAEGFFGSKKLQNSGIVQILHDGSDFAAA